MNFEEAIVNKIVEEFFKPQPGMTSQMQTDGTYAPLLSYYPAPATSVIVALYKAKETEILDAITKTFDMDVLAQQIADKLLISLQEVRPSWSSSSTYGEQFQKDVRAKVIDQLAKIQIDAILAEENNGKETP